MDFYLTTSASTLPCFQITWKVREVFTINEPLSRGAQYKFRVEHAVLNVRYELNMPYFKLNMRYFW